MHIMDVEIDQLTPYKLNAKKHPKIQIEGIAESIKRFGFTQPIVIDKDNEIVIGHGRLEAAKLLGLKKVPTLRVSDLKPNEIKALRLIDNRISEQPWDKDLLKLDLGAMDFNFETFNISFADFTAVEKPPVEEKESPVEEGTVPSHVRMIQLFLSDTTQPKFLEWVASLQSVWGTDNLTDTVFEAMKYAYDSVAKNER